MLSRPAPPRLWLRADSQRPVLAAHLEQVAGRFGAAGWRVIRGPEPLAGEAAVLAVLDDPWCAPRPELAQALAAARSSAPAWRVPRLGGLPGDTGWAVDRGPFTELEDERRAAREARRRHQASGVAGAPVALAVAPAEQAVELASRGWPPPPESTALVPTVRVYRYSDPADHPRSELDAYLPDRPGVWLELGCGGGAFAARHRAPGWRWIGVEPDREMAQVARRRLDLVLAIGAEEALAAIRGPLAGVVMADVLEHLEQPERILRLISVRLAEDGRLIVAFPNSAWFPVLAALGQGRWDPTLSGVQARDHRTVLTPDSFAWRANEAGFEVERLEPLPAPVLPWRLRWRAEILGRLSGLDRRILAAPQWAAVLRPRRGRPEGSRSCA